MKKLIKNDYKRNKIIILNVDSKRKLYPSYFLTKNDGIANGFCLFKIMDLYESEMHEMYWCVFL